MFADQQRLGQINATWKLYRRISLRSVHGYTKCGYWSDHARYASGDGMETEDYNAIEDRVDLNISTWNYVRSFLPKSLHEVLETEHKD